MPPHVISVIGAMNYDLIMVTNRVPEGGESLLANTYHEALGGKGLNAAIAAYRTSHKKPYERNSETVGAPGEANVQAVMPDVSSSPPPLDDGDEDDIQVRMVSAVGEDEYAKLFEASLKENGVDTSGLVTMPGKRSPVCFVIVEQYSGENRCLFTAGAGAAWKEENFMKVEDLAPQGPRPDLVVAQMEIRKEVVQQMIETAGNAGIDFLLNAAPADPITMRSYRHITHLLVNESEAAIMSGRDLDEVNEDTWPTIAQEFLNRGVKNVVLTLGEKGAYYATATDCCHVPAYKVKVVDTTGAGDTFTGAYASEYLRQNIAGNWDIKSAIIRANKAAARNIGELGGQKGVPWADELDKFEAELNVTKSSEAIIEEENATKIEKGNAGNDENLPSVVGLHID